MPNELVSMQITCCRLQEDEQHGIAYTFSPANQMQAGIDAGLFLESNSVAGLHGSGRFGVSYAAIAEAAATGMLHMPCIHALGLQK